MEINYFNNNIFVCFVKVQYFTINGYVLNKISID